MFIKACRLTRDAEVRFTGQGDPVANVSVAYNYGKKGDDGKFPTQFLEATLWGKRAESLAPYLTKGAQIVIYATDLHIEEYQGKNGTGHKLAARVSDIELVGGRPEEKKPGEGTQKPATNKLNNPPAGGGAPDFDMDYIPF